MNYMSFYVGDLILRCSGSPSQMLAIALAWNPWSMVRVVSFIILGVVLAEPLLSRLPGQWPSASGRGRWLLVGAAGLLVDILLNSDDNEAAVYSQKCLRCELREPTKCTSMGYDTCLDKVKVRLLPKP